MKEMMNGGKTGEEKAMEKEESKDEVLKNLILNLSPKALAERFKQEEAEGNLEPFITFLVNDDALLASVSWWEKWLTNSQVKLFEAAIKDRKLRDAEKLKTDIFPLGLEKKFSPEELHAIFSNIGAVQLTYGCSMACKLCGLDALPGVREHIPFPQVKHLLQQFGNIFPKEGINTFFYYASDPWDYKSEDDGEKRDFKDVYRLAKEFTQKSSCIRTRKVTDVQWFYDLGELKEGENFNAEISTLGLSSGQIYALYGKVDNEKLDVLGSRDRRGIGRDILESPDSIKGPGIGCFDGVVLTPRGLYSSVQLCVSEQYPQGMAIVPFERCDIDRVKVGMRIEEALQYVIPIHRNIKGSGNVKYENGLSEFEVYTGERNIYLRVDENFIIIEIDSHGVETEIQKYFEGIEGEIRALENSEYSEGDMKFLSSKYTKSVSYWPLLRAPERKKDNFSLEDEKYFFFRKK